MNVLIFETKGVDVEEMRGLAINKFPFPIILLNGSDSPNGRIFTLIHELIHIIQKESAICDLTEHEDIEVFCNKLAGRILVPKYYLLNHDIVQYNEGREWDEDDLRTLSHYFSVSRAVILTRLRMLNKTSQIFYDDTIRRWEEEGKGKFKPKGGFFDYRTIIKQNGTLFTRQMLKAYDKNQINSVEFSRYMGGIKLKHIHDLQENIWGQ